jgi:hypothetical protein
VRWRWTLSAELRVCRNPRGATARLPQRLVSQTLTLQSYVDSNHLPLSQHRVSPFELVDPTKPGHRRFIALWLVDPHKRIISTANVPPQQRSWWTESALGATDEGRTETFSKLPADIIDLLPIENIDAASAAGREEKLPLELKEMVRDYCSDTGLGLMSRKEAEKHCATLMQERSAHDKTTEDDWQKQSYSFCEH